MIEHWIDAGRKKGCVWQKAISRRLSVVPAGLWIMSLAVLLAVIRPAWCHAPRPSNLNAIANETGSISYMFYRNGNTFGYRDAFGTHADCPQLNHAGNQVAYCETSDNGGGAYICNLDTGEKKLVFEEMATNFYNGPSTELAVHDWSPDDGKFFYSQHGSWMILYEAATGKQLASLDIGGLVAMSWLTTNSILCVTKFSTNAVDLRVIQEQGNGKWKETSKLSKVGSAGLTVLSSNTIAWNQADGIWGMNLDSKVVNLLGQAPAGQSLEGFAFSQENGQFLLKCKQKNQASLWRLDAGSMSNQPPSLLLKSSGIRSAQWVNGGKGYAYLDADNKLVIQADANSAPVRLFEHGRVDSFAVSADGRHLVITAIASNEPSFGIWKYEVAENTVKCVVPGAERGLAHIRPAVPQFASISGPSNRHLNLVIYKPVNFDRHKKYPVVIVNTPYVAAEPYMKQYALAVANAGGYFVIVDRWSWFDKNGFEDAWSENETCVINYLSEEPTIDHKRIYLVSNCIESNFLKDYAAKYPGTVAGGVMLIANDLPDPANFASGSSAPKLLISTCDTWEGKGERMQKYQQTAAQSGVEVTYIVHRNTKHDFVSKESQRDRIRAMLQLVFEN